jgi:indole-3-glycerol phosphate synthase
MSLLDDILESTRRRIEGSRAKLTDAALEQRIAAQDPPRGFARALAGEGLSLIAEIKRRSPSKGDLDLDLDASKTAAAFAEGGAAAISVLTEPDHFSGSIEDLRAARTAGLPVLRKDFILDPFQVLESRAEGADAVIVIVRVLGPELKEIVAAVASLGMDALVEVWDERDLERALDSGASLIGVNHRDLETFEVDPERTSKLAPLLPDGVLLVGLSGVSGRDDVVALEEAGARAVLIGESLVTSADPAAKARELMGR